MPNFIDLTGQVFSRLLVLERAPNAVRSGRTVWLCRCECGKEKLVQSMDLTSGGTHSCGCLRSEATRARNLKNVTHGCTRGHKTAGAYRSWSGMLDRCFNSKGKAWGGYGGRGVSVCERWRGRDGFANFCADMGEKPDGMTLDRIDVNGHYEPSNCRWATVAEQNRNRRKVGVLQSFSMQELVAEIARRRSNLSLVRPLLTGEAA
jgi:hypothetical protein